MPTSLDRSHQGDKFVPIHGWRNATPASVRRPSVRTRHYPKETYPSTDRTVQLGNHEGGW